MDAALSFADVTIADERKVLIFIRGLSRGEDRRYILQQKCATLDEVYEAVIYLSKSKVLRSWRRAWTGEGRLLEGRVEGTMRRVRRGG